MQSASPMARAAVVLAVGTRFNGHASSETWQSIATSADCASVEAGLPGDSDDARANAPDRFEQAKHLLRLAAVRNGEQHIDRLDDAEIAVRRFRRVQEKR